MRPYILARGATHAQTTGGYSAADRGDLAPTADLNDTTNTLATALASFLTANEAPAAADRQEAADVLLGLIASTTELTGPYLGAVYGLEGVGELWGGVGDGTGDTQTRPLRGVRRQVLSAVSAAVHPGMVQQAEAELVRAQQALLTTLPLNVTSRIQASLPRAAARVFCFLKCVCNV
jgi:hypothetical protein